MPIGGLISGLGSVVGGLFGSSSADKAAKQQAQSIQSAIDLQKQEFDQTQRNLLPFLNAGTTALPIILSLATGMGLPAPPSPTDASLRTAFTASPGYQYQLGQTMDAIQNSAAGRSGAVSGNMLRALQSNASGLANQDWWNFYNNLNNNWIQRYQLLQNLISGGQGAAAGIGQFGQQSVGNLGNLLTAQGNALATGTLGSANALSNAFAGLTNNSGLTSGLSHLFSGGANGGGSVVSSDFPSGIGGDFAGVAGAGPVVQFGPDDFGGGF